MPCSASHSSGRARCPRAGPSSDAAFGAVGFFCHIQIGDVSTSLNQKWAEVLKRRNLSSAADFDRRRNRHQKLFQTGDLHFSRSPPAKDNSRFPHDLLAFIAANQFR